MRLSHGENRKVHDDNLAELKFAKAIRENFLKLKFEISPRSYRI